MYSVRLCVCEREREAGRGLGEKEGEAVLFVACQQLLETSFPSMCESYLAGMLGLYQVQPGEGGFHKRTRPELKSQCVAG